MGMFVGHRLEIGGHAPSDAQKLRPGLRHIANIMALRKAVTNQQNQNQVLLAFMQINFGTVQCVLYLYNSQHYNV